MAQAQDETSEKVILGRITGVYGVKGWVKVFSHTDPMEAIVDYSPWFIRAEHRKNSPWTEVKLKAGKRHAKTVVAKLEHCNDRDEAMAYVGTEIAIDLHQLEELRAKNEFYWRDLIGLRVINQQDVELSPGRLEGLLAARDIHVREVREQLDSVARQLIAEVNELHTQGLTSGGRGVMFFTGDSMHTIGINEALLNNENLVAIGQTGTAADNDIALAIADLGRSSLYGSDRKSVSESYRSAITDVAGRSSSYQFMVENQLSLVASLSARMASVSGVSLDEEGANLVRYQNSYNAAAKVIATVQEMYDTLLNIV